MASEGLGQDLEISHITGYGLRHGFKSELWRLISFVTLGQLFNFSGLSFLICTIKVLKSICLKGIKWGNKYEAFT